MSAPAFGYPMSSVLSQFPTLSSIHPPTPTHTTKPRCIQQAFPMWAARNFGSSTVGTVIYKSSIATATPHCDRQLQAAISPGLKIGISYAVHHAGRGQASESAITFTALSTSPGLEIGHHLHKVIHLAGPRAQLSRPLRRLSRRRRAASGATDPRSAGLRQPRNTLRNAQLPQKLEYAPQEIRNEEDDNRKQADCGDEPLSAHLARQHLLVCRNGKDGLLPYTSVQLKKRSDG